MLLANRIRSSDIPFETGKNENIFSVLIDILDKEMRQNLQAYPHHA